MTSCILTVIKDEQEYLDEWIRYHLDIGVDHLFIFEDIDSTSHQDICSKYSERVSLARIDTILDKESKSLACLYKKTKEHNPQDIYFKSGIRWIKSVYPNQYDWCFVIDNDEFISTEKPLHDTLSLYNDYDAFVLQWKIYGANGHIFKPNYADSGIVETYTKESPHHGHHVLEWTTKTCYRVSTFKEAFFKNNHQPSDTCRWCRSDFSHIRGNITYDNIYIKHYITKSLEEYVAKKSRGYFMGFARTVDFFFDINTDMLSVNRSLRRQLRDGVLVILPYKQSSAQGNELRLALTGWRKFCRFKYHFVVIGDFDQTFVTDYPWVEFIDYPSMDKVEGQYTPHLDRLRKFEYVIDKYQGRYESFIAMCDDEYAIKPFTFFDIFKTHYHQLSFEGDRTSPTSYWIYDKYKTKQLLVRENLHAVNYTTHYPYYYEVKKLKEIWDRFDMRKESYVLEDVYFNYFEHEEAILDSTVRLGIWWKKIYDREFHKAIENPRIKFCCNSVEGYSKELENSLSELYLK